MKVFVTGATGFVGSVVVPELQATGHRVLGLARSDAAADALARAGADVYRGDLTDTDRLAAGARSCDGVIHLAFIHDFSAWAASIETDRLAVEAMLGALEGSGKPFVLTSGTAIIALGPNVAPVRTVTEADAPASVDVPRAAAEAAAVAAAERGVRTSIVRLSPTVHGAGDHGLIPELIRLARQKGVAAYIGDGANRWPAVHRIDAARVYRLALENAVPGTRFHAVAEEGIAMREIAAAIGEGVGVPVRTVAQDEAPAHFDWLARFVGLDNPSSSAFTRETLRWQPEQMDLLTDMRQSGYFGEVARL